MEIISRLARMHHEILVFISRTEIFYIQKNLESYNFKVDTATKQTEEIWQKEIWTQ